MTAAGRILRTGQQTCFDEDGAVLPCAGSGQDGEYRKGVPWPEPRFGPGDEMVEDLLTGLVWTADANPAEFPLTWHEAGDFIRAMNDSGAHGHDDWRLPAREELRSLISYETRRPALPDGHPFRNVYLGWYWSSTTAAINRDYAWYVHLDGARMFYGGKSQYSMVWPVRGEIKISGFAAGRPESRFAEEGEEVLDRLTGLCWLRQADLSGRPVSWREALELVAAMNAKADSRNWRLPNINELESLVDCGHHSPALPGGHPFLGLRDVYWSSTTSCFEPDWSWALYLDKGALGVGFKKKPEFYAWPVRDALPDPAGAGRI
jgi:hypothetical protein